MKLTMTKRRKHCGRTILAMMLFLSLILSMFAPLTFITVQATEQEETNIEKLITSKVSAISWLKTQLAAVDEDVTGALSNDICSILAVLSMMGEICTSDIPDAWNQDHEDKNLDELIHLYLATQDKNYMETAVAQQNEDGGFGLTQAYTSDNYDTYLVLMAETYKRQLSENSSHLAYSTEKALGYLLSNQNTDGGFGYHSKDVSRPRLTAEIGIMMLSLGAEVSYEKIDGYCKEQFTSQFDAKNFAEQAAIARYLYKREQVEDVTAIETAVMSVQQENGSINDSIADTLQYVLLMEEIEEYYQLELVISDMHTTADTYVLEAEEETTVTITTDFSYTTNHPATVIVHYTLLENGESIFTVDKELSLLPEGDKAEATNAITCTAKPDNDYTLRTEIIAGEDGAEQIYAAKEMSLGVHVTEEKELVLEVNENQDSENALDLNWTDISTEDERYQYRLYRKVADGDWESCSTWDGEEKVRVLNVYPIDAAKNYLEGWMESIVSDMGENAGKGLFEIDTVHIDDYNYAPKKYLLDDNGNYQYDVLMFGTYDYNNRRDLSYNAYIETVAYAESGRGILFGHDTITSLYSRYYFRLLGEKMGVKFIRNSTIVASTKIRVVNKGILTSYPWKLEGELTIPYTHTLDQYVGGTLGSTVWMEFIDDYRTDSVTGAKDNAYLFSKNALAMIQTGHSAGQATDDECKIIANTLFYLKQLTGNTKAADNDFRDITVPEIESISDLSEDNTLDLTATDKGTDYSYYVEGRGTEQNKKSNEVTTTATSGVEGFIVAVTDSADTEDILTYNEEGELTNEIIPAKNGKLTYSMENQEAGKTVYVHVYAIDKAGNISEKQTKEIVIPEKIHYLSVLYGMVATQNSLVISCNEANIDGDIYGRSGIQFQGTILNLDGTASSAGNISASGWKINIPEKQENAEPLTLPDFREQIRKDMESAEMLEELTSYSSTEITVPTICNQTTGAWSNDVKLLASLLSKGSISLNANTVTMGEDTPVVLCSETGNISIQATKVTGTGLIYAPEGTVTINVSEFNFQGTIIAKEIRVQAGYYTQTGLNTTEE